MEQLCEARALFDRSCWAIPNDEESSFLDATADEIKMKLTKASNTAPGADGVEYHHLRSLDPCGRLLELIYWTVWRIGLLDAWCRSRTILIHKNGSCSDASNFRPISMLSTMFKIMSGIISNRLASAAVDLGWLSPE